MNSVKDEVFWIIMGVAENAISDGEVSRAEINEHTDAILSAFKRGSAVVVKELEWEQIVAEAWFAQNGLGGTYQIEFDEGWQRYRAMLNTAGETLEVGSPFDTLEAAKAACQADLVKRITSAVEPKNSAANLDSAPSTQNGLGSSVEPSGVVVSDGSVLYAAHMAHCDYFEPAPDFMSLGDEERERWRKIEESFIKRSGVEPSGVVITAEMARRLEPLLPPFCASPKELSEAITAVLSPRSEGDRRAEVEAVIQARDERKKHEDEARAVEPSGAVTDEAVQWALKTVEAAFVTFRHYADLHRAKGTPEGDTKADANAKEALCLSEALNILTAAFSSRTEEEVRADERERLAKLALSDASSLCVERYLPDERATALRYLAGWLRSLTNGGG